jgi:hypothetical protein
MWMRVRPTRFRCAIDRDIEAAAERERTLVLRDLIALRQVRIEVVLAREDRQRLDVAAERERRLDRVIDGRAVQDGQGTWHAEADRTDVRVRRRAERPCCSRRRSWCGSAAARGFLNQ